MAAGSIRLTFRNDSSRGLHLSKAVECLALPNPTADVAERGGITGAWVQLESKSGEVIYRLDMPSLAGCIAAVGDDEYNVLVPNYPEAAYAAVYAPSSGGRQTMELFGTASTLAGRFDIPERRPVEKKQTVTLPSDICGNGRGRVLDCYSVVYHGRTDGIYNFVILGDRFAQSEQSVFTEKANTCVNYLLSRPPFTHAFCMGAMNVFFVEVESYKEDPAYFNTQFASGSSTSISWDYGAVTTVCDALFAKDGKPFWNWAGVLTNYSGKRTGSGYIGRPHQFACGTYTGWKHFTRTDCQRTFQHEFGHTAYLLRDEYANSGSDSYSGGEPNSVNITKEHTLEALKWKEFVTPGVQIPTSNKSDSDVGCYEGAGTYEHGLYRPQYNCVMRDQSDSEGYLCTVCTHEATKIMARCVGLAVPAPGSLQYSHMSGKWMNLVVASEVKTQYKSYHNRSDYDAIVGELRVLNIGPQTRALLSDAGIALSGTADVLEAYADVNARGLWYIVPKGSRKTYYLYGFKLAHDNEIAAGELKLPSYLSSTLYDGVRVGTEMHVFCGDGGCLSYGKQDDHGNIKENFAVQEVSGLAVPPGISSLSTDYERARIMVAVVDGHTVKIAAYELMTSSWNTSGFIAMPFPDGQAPLCHSVKISQLGNMVHVAARTDDGIVHGIFNTVSMTWGAVVTAVNTEAEPVSQYDICTDGRNAYLLTYDEQKALLYSYNTIEREWRRLADVTTSMGLSHGIISSLGVDMLHSNLHITLLENQKAKHAVFNPASATWISSLVEIELLLPMQDTIGAMMLHADANQLHLILSDMHTVNL